MKRRKLKECAGKSGTILITLEKKPPVEKDIYIKMRTALFERCFNKGYNASLTVMPLGCFFPLLPLVFITERCCVSLLSNSYYDT